MKTKIISITKSLIDGVELNAEELIVYTARVSNPNNQLNMETAEKLISYMVKHNHWSPFEMADMTIEIKTSRAIAQQIIRHRSFSFQEFSQRYSSVSEIEPLKLRYKAETNRQSSSDLVESDNDFYFRAKSLENLTSQLYIDMIEKGIAKECARGILPLNTQTTIYMKGSVRSWLHYLQIRSGQDTQLEHREIALSILELFKIKFPIIYKSLF